MIGRRGSSFGLQLFSVAIVLVMFVYGFYLYRSVSSQLENVEKENGDLVLEREDLSRDIQVLRESKSKLEQLLKDKESQCAGNEDRLGSEIKKLREDISKEKMTCKERSSLWDAEKDKLRSQIQELENGKSEYMTRINEIETLSSSLKEENFELKKTKQESLNEIAKLNDNVANLERHIKELEKYKELYELQKPKSVGETKKEAQPKKEEDEQDLQIVQPGNGKRYNGIETSKPKDPSEPERRPDIHSDQALDKQVAPPVIAKPEKGKEENFHEKIENLAQLPPHHGNVEANPVREPKLEEHDTLENHPKPVNEPMIPDAKVLAGDKIGFRPDGKIQAPNIPGEGDDEDLEAERGPNGDKEAPQGARHLPEGANDNDVELDNQNQRLEKEP